MEEYEKVIMFKRLEKGALSRRYRLQDSPSQASKNRVVPLQHLQASLASWVAPFSAFLTVEDVCYCIRRDTVKKRPRRRRDEPLAPVSSFRKIVDIGK